LRKGDQVTTHVHTAAGTDDPHIHGQPFRSPTAFPVTFDAN
jgi:hypothetical protein